MSDTGVTAEALARRALDFDEPTLLLVPERVDEDGVGIYRDTLLTIPKEMRAAGVNADLMHAAGERRALSQYSAGLALDLAVAITANLSYDTAKATVEFLYGWIAKHSSGVEPPQIRLQIDRIANADGQEIEGVTIEAPANEQTAVEIIHALTNK